MEGCGDPADQVHYPGVPVDLEQVGDFAGGGDRHPGQVVAGQVDQHGVFGDFFAVGAHF